MSQLMLTYPIPSTSSSSSTIMSQDFSLFMDNGKSSNKNIESIHSGHFMVSEIDDENVAFEEKSNQELGHESDNEADREENRLPSNIELCSREDTQAYCGLNSNNLVLIDQSLSKLFECMSLAYNGKLTSPKWKTFKGLKLPIKDKIRLNNIIWRAWHMQYIAGRNPVVCQFSSPVDSKHHKRNESIVLEGKYWKRHIEAVKAEYNKWRMFKLGKIGGTSFAPSRPLGSFDWENRLPRLSEDVFFDWNTEWDTEFSTSATSSVGTSGVMNNNYDNSYYNFGMRSEFMQPRLEQLQPNVDMMDTFEPIQDYITRFQTSLPTVQEECLPSNDLMDNSMITTAQTGSYMQQASTSQQNTNISYGSTTNASLQTASGFIPNNMISKLEMQQPQATNDAAYSFNVQQQQQQQQQPAPQMSNFMGPADTIMQPLTTSTMGFSLSQTHQQQEQPTNNFNFQTQTPQANYGFYQEQSQQQQQQSQQQQQQQAATCLPMKQFSPQFYVPSNSNNQIVNNPILSNQLEAVRMLPTEQIPMSMTSRTLRTRSRSISNSQLQQPRQQQQQQQQQQPQQQQQQMQSKSKPTPSSALSGPTSSQTIKSLLSKPSMLGQCDSGDFRAPITPIMTPSQQPQQQQLILHPSVVQRQSSQRGQVERSRSLPVYRKANAKLNNSQMNQQEQQQQQQQALVNQPMVVTASLSNEQLQSAMFGSQQPTRQCQQQFESLDYSQNPVSYLPQSINRSNSTSTMFNDFTKPTLHNSMAASSSSSMDNVSTNFDQPASSSSLLSGPAFPGSVPSKAHYNASSLYQNNHSSSSSSPVSFSSSATKKLKCDGNVNTSPLFHGLDSSEPLFQHSKHIKSEFAFSSALSSVPGPSVKREERVMHKERRRVCHINAEQKRRCNIKNGFDTLKNILPSLCVSANTKISKAAMLQKGAEYIRVLKNEKFEQQKEYHLLKQQVDSINQTISLFQSQLPATGAPVTNHRSAQIKQNFSDYVRERTHQNWKFYIFSIMMESLLESYSSTVATGNFDEFCKTVLRWLDQDCSLIVLRKDILNSLRFVSTSTNVLTHPESLQEEILSKVSQHNSKFSSTKDGDSSQGSGGNYFGNF